MVNFSELLQKNKIPRYAAHYLNYDKLKTLIYQCRDEAKGTGSQTVNQQSLLEALKSAQRQHLKGLLMSRADNSLAKFVYQWENDLQKVNGFSQGRFKELQNHIRMLQRSLKEKPTGQAELQDLAESAERVSKYLIELHTFIQQNAIGFQKIVKKLDKEIKLDIRTWMEIRLQKEPFLTIPLSHMLLPLSEVYEYLRSDHSGQPKEKWVPPQDFERETTKYWVSLETAFQLKVALLKYLPILVVETGKKETQTGKNEASDAHWISSVYLDNDQAHIYQERIYRQENAQLVRVRFYSHTPDKEVFIERKTHHESWVQASSRKERFNLRTESLPAYLDGSLDLRQYFSQQVLADRMTEEEGNRSLVLATEIQQMILKYDLQPSVRTCYRRSAFQPSDNNSVRLTFDIDLQLIREKETEHWNLQTAGQNLTSKDIFSFPHAILEVKLQDHPPEWLSDILNRPDVVPAYKFSKYLTAMALFRTHQVKVLPPWFKSPSLYSPLKYWGFNITLLEESPNRTKTIRKSPSVLALQEEDRLANRVSNSLDDTSDSDNEDINDRQEDISENRDLEAGDVPLHNLNLSLEPQDPRPLQDRNHDLSGRKLPKVLKALPKVEPKTYFANERTFIQWLSASLLLVSLSMILISIGRDEAWVTGLIMFPIAMLFTIYALAQFHWRARKIRQLSPTGYFDPIGPSLLVFFLLVGMIATIIVLGVLHNEQNQDQVDNSSPSTQLMIDPNQPDSLEWNLIAKNHTFQSLEETLTSCFGQKWQPDNKPDQYRMQFVFTGVYQTGPFVLRIRRYPDLSEPEQVTMKLKALENEFQPITTKSQFQSDQKEKMEWQFTNQNDFSPEWSLTIQSYLFRGKDTSNSTYWLSLFPEMGNSVTSSRRQFENIKKTGVLWIDQKPITLDLEAKLDTLNQLEIDFQLPVITDLNEQITKGREIYSLISQCLS